MLRRNRRREIQVSTLGLTIQKGKSLETLSWHDVVYVNTKLERFGILGISWGKRTEIHLVIADGREFKFNHSYERIDELIEEIKELLSDENG